MRRGIAKVILVGVLGVVCVFGFVGADAATVCTPTTDPAACVTTAPYPLVAAKAGPAFAVAGLDRSEPAGGAALTVNGTPAVLAGIDCFNGKVEIYVYVAGRFMNYVTGRSC